MSRSVAIGIGCRRGCAAPVIEALVRQALDLVPNARPVGIFTIADKRGEAGLSEASDRLGLPLAHFSCEALREVMPRTMTRSSRVERLVGVASVAEAAALAGAGAGSELLVPRIAQHGATCAIAGLKDHAA